MLHFFNPNLHSSALFAFGAAGHVALNLGLVALLALMVAHREELKALRQSRTFMAGSAGFVLALEATSYALKFIYPQAELWDRLPFQLCSTLKIVITLLVLIGRYDWVKHVAVLAMGCGVISFVNLNLHGESFQNFAWWHYVIGHYYLFAAPLFFFLVGEFRFELKAHLFMCLGLFLWSFTFFLVNWAFDTNYMYTGPHNHTAVPFVPARMMIWPLNYVTYVLIAVLMVNGGYAILRFFQRARETQPELVTAQ